MPIGATPVPMGAVADFVCRGGDPPGDDVEVRLDCWAAFSKKLKLCGLEAGDEVLLARERCCCCCCCRGLGDGPVEASC